jgi:transposase-like protein
MGQSELEVEERRLRTVEMVRDGVSVRDIAAALGVSASQVRRYVSDALKVAREDLRDKVGEYVAVEYARIDRLQAMLWNKINGQLDTAVEYADDESGEPKLKSSPFFDPKLIDTYLKLSESKRKLVGMDSPTKTETKVTVSSMTDHELEQEARRMGLPELPPEPTVE